MIPHTKPQTALPRKPSLVAVIGSPSSASYELWHSESFVQ